MIGKNFQWKCLLQTHYIHVRHVTTPTVNPACFVPFHRQISIKGSSEEAVSKLLLNYFYFL